MWTIWKMKKSLRTTVFSFSLFLVLEVAVFSSRSFAIKIEDNIEYFFFNLAFGKVYVGEWNGRSVAIKVCQDIQNVDNFLKEALIMTSVSPNRNKTCERRFRSFLISNNWPRVVPIYLFCHLQTNSTTSKRCSSVRGQYRWKRAINSSWILSRRWHFFFDIE